MPIKVVNSMEEYIDHPINKLLFAVEPDLMKELEEPFKAPFTNLSLYCSTPFYLEAMTNGIDKAETLIELTKIFGDSVENMMAFGDGFNDCKMIQAAGVGVCMSNGDERCKAIADYIAKSNDEDGIKYALDELLPEIVK